MKKLDLYIIKKFLGTFVLSIILITIICVVFDVAEHLEKFIENKASFEKVVIDYYLNFIPYFVNLFSALFTFISVIFFTSKLAAKTEIIAILSSGISYKRFLRPYLISASIIAIGSYLLSGYIIPESSKARLAFYSKYVKNKNINKSKHIHRQLRPGVYIYMSKYSVDSNTGWNFSIDEFKEKKLVNRLTSKKIVWNEDIEKWTIYDYTIRNINGTLESIVHGKCKDTTLGMKHTEFSRGTNIKEEMTNPELSEYIDQQIVRGNGNVKEFIIENHKRSASAFSTIILTLIGVCLSSKKSRNGMGFNLGMGLALSFTYIMFMQVSITFATNGNFNEFLAAWTPNIIFGIIAAGLYLRFKK